MLHSVSQDVNYVYNFIYLINEHHIAELALKKKIVHDSFRDKETETK